MLGLCAVLEVLLLLRALTVTGVELLWHKRMLRYLRVLEMLTVRAVVGMTTSSTVTTTSSFRA
jgi:hypothetical protein